MKRFVAAYGRTMKTKVPLWYAYVTMTVGAFYGAWMQAEAEAERLGLRLSWTSRVVFWAPIVLVLGWTWAIVKVVQARRVAPA